MIAVVGSINLDLVAPVAHHPVPGETVLGGVIARYPGGKGANQAVAAARLGAAVTMVGRVGRDDAGEMLLGAIRDEGVDTSRIVRTDGVPTGQALITVDLLGENAIVVSPGANTRLGVGDCEAAAELLRTAPVTVLQQEVPEAANRAAARLAGGTLIYNPAPGTTGAALPAGVDLLVPNRTELAALTGQPVPGTPAEVVAAARQVTGAAAVVVTLGGDGALIVEDSSTLHIRAHPVRPVDTTAAGDSFCGALAVALAEGRTLEQAVRWACAVAAISTTRAGAMPSLAHRSEVEEFLAEK